MKEIMIDVAVKGTRVAILENNEPVEFYIERPDTESLVGNIYRGKVCSVLRGMQAAFVDIGYERNAFLHVGDAISYEDEEITDNLNNLDIRNFLKPGQEITVQVIKEPIDTKGPRITTQITLPGRDMVFLPQADYVGVSRRISSDVERKRLKKFAESIRPNDAGLIIRTASEGLSIEDLKKDLVFLQKNWKKIKLKERFGKVPRLLHKDLDLVYRTVRDSFTPDVDKFIINNKKEYKNVLEMIGILSPELKSRVKLFTKDYDMFEFYNIESKITQTLSRKVWLKCGGYIVIDKTEALTVIDVNTGKYVGKQNLEKTALKTNIQAATEIAKQIRLRDIGGIIVIDFIDMLQDGHQRQVLNELRSALKRDKTKTTVVGITGLGLIEMTRKKVRQGLNSYMTTECSHCNGTGTVVAPESVALKIEKKIGEYARKRIKGALKVEVHPTVAMILKGERNRNLKLIQKTYRKKVKISENESISKNDAVINGDGINSESKKCQ